MERLCQRDAAYRIICGGNLPDHTAISRFRAVSAEHMEKLFTQVLTLCARIGLVSLGVAALDGVKIASNASLSANRTEAGLRSAAAAEERAQELVREHARAAAAEHAAANECDDEMFGSDGRGDDVPADLIGPRSRAARIAEALADVENVNGDRATAQVAAVRKAAARSDAATERWIGKCRTTCVNAKNSVRKPARRRRKSKSRS